MSSVQVYKIIRSGYRLGVFLYEDSIELNYINDKEDWTPLLGGCLPIKKDLKGLEKLNLLIRYQDLAVEEIKRHEKNNLGGLYI